MDSQESKSQAVKHFYEFGPFRLDLEQRLLWNEAETVALAPKVFETLILLIEHRGRVVKKEEMMKALWPDRFVEESNLTHLYFKIDDRNAFLERLQKSNRNPFLTDDIVITVLDPDGRKVMFGTA